MKSEVCCIKINSFDDFKYPLNELSKGWLFRGHERAEWALQTSVERILKKRNEQFCKIYNCNMSDIDEKNHFSKLKDEYFAIEEYEKLAFLQVPKMKKIELLARMQHYGTPTRLLDVTPSFLIALFFHEFQSRVQSQADRLPPS